MAEYALVTMVVASLAVALSSISESQLATGLPVTTARAQALVAKTARANGVPVASARATLARAPYPRAALRFLYTAGWVGGRTAAAECLLAKATPGSTERRLAVELRKDAKVVARLRRMDVTVTQAARALTRGTAAAC
jgi:hypothetical protein